MPRFLPSNKGLHVALNESVLEFVQEALADIEGVYTDGVHDSSPVNVIKGLTMQEPSEDNAIGEVNFKWDEEKDNFGHKAFVTKDYKKGQVRVSVVLTKQGELRLDIRTWYNADE